MKNENEIDELLKIAVAARLEGCDFLSSFTYAQLADGYNGIGPEFLPPLVREKVSDFLHIFKPAAVGHDLRNEMSDGTRESFRAANEEFYRNCIRLADYHYPWYSRYRYRARAAALVLYAFVSAEHFGWRAWLEAKERHAAKMASDNSVWKTKEDNMKKLMIVFAAVAAILVTGCGTPGKMRDIELKGMHVNGYSEVLAIGSGKLTSIPGEREALAAHYEEDTAWLSPSTKTHKLDIFLVGTNSVENSKEIIGSICKAFADVAPVVSSNNAAVAKGGGTAFDVLKASGETRKSVQLAKNAAEKVKSQLGSDKVSVGSDKVSVGSDSVADANAALTDANSTLTDANAECADCKDPAADCKDCVVK